jgi:aquaglyceroporin related protein, other eukaryote
MIMIIFGDGSVAQVLLSANPNLPPGSQNKGEYQSITWGFVLAAVVHLYLC